MRVTGGTARGIQILSPSGKAVRPTTDRVRSALFNILSAKGVEGLAVVDFYAGTGSVGIEALSRGASSVEFVEFDRKQAADILKNVSLARVSERAVIHCKDVFSALDVLKGPFDLVLMDPPYSDPFPSQLLNKIYSKGFVHSDSVVVVGHSSREPAPLSCGALSLSQDRRYGDSGLAFYLDNQVRRAN